MKKFLFLSAILIAVFMSSCSSDGYKSYVPADSKVVAKFDLATFFSQTGVDQEKLFKDLGEKLGDDFKKVKDLGIDFTSPIYIFARKNGGNIEGGAVVKVQDRAQFEKAFESKTDEKLSKAQDYSFLANNGVSLAVNDDVIVFVTSSDLGNGKVDKNVIDRLMNKKIEGDLGSNKVFAKADGSNSFASFCADMSIIPDIDLPPEAAGLSAKDLEQVRSMVIDIDASAKDGVCDFMLNTTSNDQEMQEKIDKTSKAYGFISDKAFGSFSANDLGGFVMNTDGARLMEVVKEAIAKFTGSNPQMAQMVGPYLEKASGIISKIKGNVLGVMHSPEDFVFLAEGKNITNDVVSFLNESGGGMMGGQQLMSTGDGYCLNGMLYFGYSGNSFYVTANQAAAAQPAKAMGDPAPAALTNLMKGRKMVLFANVGQMRGFAQMVGHGANDLNAFSEVFDKIKYVTISSK